MAWFSDSTTHKQSRPSQPIYVPQFRSNNNIHQQQQPYNNNNNNNNRTHFPSTNDSPHFTFNRSTPRPRGRGGYGFGPPRHHQQQQQQQPRSYDPSYRNNRSPFETNAEPENGSNGLNGVVANFEAYDSIPVEATGENVPPPVNVFAETELHDDLKNNIERCKYVKPTPVQRYAIPIAVAGRDLMACAQTGSGKTAAFCFPIISGIMKERLASEFSDMKLCGGSDVAFPTALILSPTRELSCQIYAEATKFAYQTGVKIAVCYGGAPIGQQLRVLERGVDILVATPGRLVDLIERERISLKKIKYLALDEADRMLDMGFEHQIRNIVQQMHMPPPGDRQTLLFSATFPDNIQKLASDFLSNYVFLAVGRVGSSTELIVQKVESVQDMEKRNRLVDLLQHNVVNGKLALTLVFVETKKGADALEHWLCRSGFPAIAIHGDKVQMERERALRSFKRGLTPIMVATDVASRGLDIPHVAHVINFDLPRDIDDYVHRIGRTGRAGQTGLATAFFCSKNLPIAKSLVGLLQEAKQEVPSWLVQCSESVVPGGRNSVGSQRSPWRGNYGGRDFRTATEPGMESYNNYNSSYSNYGDNGFHNVPEQVENYNYSSTYSNGDHAANTYTDASVEVQNNNCSFESTNTGFAGGYGYTDAGLLEGSNGQNGPCGYASVVPTGWD
ncbi:DEAD-box ATP-dependent RNA helicase 52C-like [Trifolium pratense]|uniref:DEAD-box ATP-dependent RNA helicase 52C-like n=1 Tax=Trifolium pratense TaxID=57577 RepID=UPI001E693F7A|nr:DEAD-box ATP-dependent RNA helicase 52C-like [Trifolium pratense]